MIGSIVCPKGTLSLVNKVLKRTGRYVKAKEILLKQYNIRIYLEVQDEVS